MAEDEEEQGQGVEWMEGKEEGGRGRRGGGGGGERREEEGEAGRGKRAK